MKFDGRAQARVGPGSDTPLVTSATERQLWCSHVVGSLLYGLFQVMRLGSSLARLDKPLFDFTMLGPHDVTVDTHLHPTCVTVHLQCSKMDQFGCGVDI